MNPNYQRSKELEEDVLICLSQFGSTTAKQLALWLFGDTNPSAMTRSHRIARRLLGKRLVVQRQGGDGKARYILGNLGAARLGIRAGYALSHLNAKHQEKIIEHLTIMHLQGYNVFGRRRIWRELDKKYRQADGVVLDGLDEGYALIYVHAMTDAIQKRITNLKQFTAVRGIGKADLLQRLEIPPATTYEQQEFKLLFAEKFRNSSVERPS